MITSDSFFTTEDNLWFKPTDHTRGPWHEHHCHAGPPTGLVARALQRALPTYRLTRLTINLARPIPYAGFRIETQLQHQGRTVAHASATIIDEQEKICASASSLHMQPQPPHPLPTHEISIGTPEEAVLGAFPIQSTLHDKPGFNGDGVETRYPPGQSGNPGPTIAWLKTVPLLTTEEPTPFERICPLADCGNAFGRNAEVDEVNFMNPDLTILLHRDPQGLWLGTQAQGFWESNGIGMSDALLFDHKGVVGRAIQTLLLRPVV